MEWTDFLHVDTDSRNLKVDQNCFWVAMDKNRCGQPCHGNLKLTVLQK